jgi:cytochrome P450
MATPAVPDDSPESVNTLVETLDDESLYSGDPFPLYARLRRDAPVAWNARTGYWAVSRHADVVAVSKDSERFCSGKGILTFEIGVEYPSPPTMMHTDPPEHTRYRKLVQPGFAPSVIRALEPAVRERAQGLVAALEPGAPVDFVSTVSVPFPLMIISELLGVGDDWPRFFEWSEAAIPGATDMTAEERAELMAEMQEYLLEMTRARRGDPRDDLVSVLANVEVDGENLTDAELVMFLNQLLVAGNETTRNMVSGGMWAFAQHPEQWQRLVADRSLVASTVEEWLRWTTSVIAFMRTATVDTVVGGTPIKSGDPLLLLYASANRDELEFGPTADQFDIGRQPNHHVAFGFGAHFCIGAALARLEGRALLDALLDRFSTVTPAGEIERTASSIIAGVRSAPLRFD